LLGDKKSFVKYDRYDIINLNTPQLSIDLGLTLNIYYSKISIAIDKIFV
jgi:hypothetical protein